MAGDPLIELTTYAGLIVFKRDYIIIMRTSCFCFTDIVATTV